MSKCPFCKTNLNTGATTCAACGAYETDYGKWWSNASFKSGIYSIPISSLFLFLGIYPDYENPSAFAFIGFIMALATIGTLAIGAIQSITKPFWTAKK